MDILKSVGGWAKQLTEVGIDAGAHADQQDQQAVDEGATFDPVELLQINFQPHGEQQVHRPEIGEQPHRFTAAVHPVEGVWSHHDAGNQQPHQVRQTDPADEAINQCPNGPKACSGVPKA